MNTQRMTHRLFSTLGAITIGLSVTLAASTPAVAQRAPIALTVQTSGYETWGRPAGMDNPKAGCGSFNDSRPVSKFNVSLQIKNNSSKVMSDWFLTIIKSNGKEAYVCYYGYENGFPSVAAGQAVNVTFAAFMERGEMATRISVNSNLGTSPAVLFDKAGKPTSGNAGSSASSAPAPSAATGRIAVSIQNSGYESWGRPAGMVNAKAGCGAFDDSHPVRKFNASIAITNNTNRVMTNWYARVFKANGKEAYVCYYGYENGFPNISPGQTVNVTFAAFMEGNEAAARMWVEDATVGRSGAIALK